MDTETLRSYVGKYRHGKVEELLRTHYKGKPSRLSDDQKQELSAHLREITYPDVKSIIAYVQKMYGETYKKSGMRESLSALNFVYKKPKVVPGKSDPVEVMKFLQKYEVLRRSKAPLYFMDGVHPQHNSRPAYGWIFKGDAKALPSNTGRKRLNINGVVNSDTKDLLISVDESINGQSTLKLFKKVLRKHPYDKKFMWLLIMLLITEVDW